MSPPACVAHVGKYRQRGLLEQRAMLEEVLREMADLEMRCVFHLCSAHKPALRELPARGTSGHRPSSVACDGAATYKRLRIDGWHDGWPWVVCLRVDSMTNRLTDHDRGLRAVVLHAWRATRALEVNFGEGGREQRPQD